LKRKGFLVSGFWFLVEEKRVSGSGTSTWNLELETWNLKLETFNKSALRCG
jgi:hypothetical protein